MDHTSQTKRGPREGEKRDYTALAGILIAGVAVAGGFALDRGRIGDLWSLTAGLLVVGGTLGAILIGTPLPVLASTARRCRGLFSHESGNGRAEADHIMRCAILARRVGPAAIEQEAETVKNSLLRRALLLVVDGIAHHEVRRQLEIDIATEEDRAEADARVFEQAGGYAPTIGIIGAVIGLIEVMRQLGNVDQVGRGIASAFVSTLYGVALANLLLLPLAARIRSKARSEAGVSELILEGVGALAEGLSLQLTRARLETFLQQGDLAPAKSVSPPQAQKAAGQSA
jgi:chemotaxis protein MotA